MSTAPHAPDDLSEDEKRRTLLRLVFGSDEQRLAQFCRALRDVIPRGTRVVVRGSAVTGVRWKDGAPFDADGPGTSDLDLTLVGADAVGAFDATGCFIPGVHSRPMGEDDPGIAPPFVELREHLTRMVGRPVNLQASRDIVIAFRGDLLGQPYVTLIDDEEEGDVQPSHLVTPPAETGP